MLCLIKSYVFTKERYHLKPYTDYIAYDYEIGSEGDIIYSFVLYNLLDQIKLYKSISKNHEVYLNNEYEDQRNIFLTKSDIVENTRRVIEIDRDGFEHSTKCNMIPLGRRGRPYTYVSSTSLFNVNLYTNMPGKGRYEHYLISPNSGEVIYDFSEDIKGFLNTYPVLKEVEASSFGDYVTIAFKGEQQGSLDKKNASLFLYNVKTEEKRSFHHNLTDLGLKEAHGALLKRVLQNGGALYYTFGHEDVFLITPDNEFKLLFDKKDKFRGELELFYWEHDEDKLQFLHFISKDQCLLKTYDLNGALLNTQEVNLPLDAYDNGVIKHQGRYFFRGSDLSYWVDCETLEVTPCKISDEISAIDSINEAGYFLGNDTSGNGVLGYLSFEDNEDLPDFEKLKKLLNSDLTEPEEDVQELVPEEYIQELEQTAWFDSYPEELKDKILKKARNNYNSKHSFDNLVLDLAYFGTSQHEDWFEAHCRDIEESMMYAYYEGLAKFYEGLIAFDDLKIEINEEKKTYAINFNSWGKSFSIDGFSISDFLFTVQYVVEEQLQSREETKQLHCYFSERPYRMYITNDKAMAAIKQKLKFEYFYDKDYLKNQA